MVKVPALTVPQLAPCASSARARRLWVIRYTQSEAQAIAGAPRHGLRGSSEPPPKSPVLTAFDCVGVAHMDLKLQNVWSVRKKARF